TRFRRSVSPRVFMRWTHRCRAGPLIFRASSIDAASSRSRYSRKPAMSFSGTAISSTERDRSRTPGRPVEVSSATISLCEIAAAAARASVGWDRAIGSTAARSRSRGSIAGWPQPTGASSIRCAPPSLGSREPAGSPAPSLAVRCRRARLAAAAFGEPDRYARLPRQVTAPTASGLDNVVVAETALSDVDGENGRLVIAGHSVEELAEKATFEDVCGLLWNGTLPSGDQRETLRAALGQARQKAFSLLPSLGDALQTPDSMEALRAAV